MTTILKESQIPLDSIYPHKCRSGAVWWTNVGRDSRAAGMRSMACDFAGSVARDYDCARDISGRVQRRRHREEGRGLSIEFTDHMQYDS
jgi:hypothetical protein